MEGRVYSPGVEACLARTMSWAWALVSFLLKRVPEVTATPIAMDTDLMTTMYCWTMTSHFRKPRQLTVKTAPSYRSYVSAAVIEFPDKINLREKGSIWLQRETLRHSREKTWLQAEKAWG